MVEREVSNLFCDCGEKMVRISKNDELIAYDCKCGLRLPTQKEIENMRRHQLLCADGEVGKRARIEQRLEFNPEFDPYKYRTRTARWQKAGHRRRVKVKKLFILAAVSCLTALIICLIWRVLS